jgi:hypothetical protein
MAELTFIFNWQDQKCLIDQILLDKGRIVSNSAMPSDKIIVLDSYQLIFDNAEDISSLMIDYPECYKSNFVVEYNEQYSHWYLFQPFCGPIIDYSPSNILKLTDSLCESSIGLRKSFYNYKHGNYADPPTILKIKYKSLCNYIKSNSVKMPYCDYRIGQHAFEEMQKGRELAPHLIAK